MLEAKRKRDNKIVKATKRKCEYLECGKMFTANKRKPRQLYCDDKCKYKAQHKQCPTCDKMIKNIHNSCSKCSFRNGKPRLKKKEFKNLDSPINPLFLEPRGSNQRKKIGLVPVEYSYGNGNTPMGAM